MSYEFRVGAFQVTAYGKHDGERAYIVQRRGGTKSELCADAEQLKDLIYACKKAMRAINR